MLNGTFDRGSKADFRRGTSTGSRAQGGAAPSRIRLKARLISVAASTTALALGAGACSGDAGDAGFEESNVSEDVAALGATQTVGPVGTAVFVSYDARNAYLTYLPGEFCTGQLNVEKMDLATGVRTPLVSGRCISAAESASNGTASFNATHLYYLEWGADEIRRVTLTGTPTDSLFASTNGAIFHRGIAVADGKVHWADNLGIRVKPGAGGATTTVFGSANTNLLGVAAPDIFFENFVPSTLTYELRRVRNTGGPSFVLHTQDKPFRPFALHANSAFWATNRSGAPSTVQRISVAGGAVTTLYSTTSSCITDVGIRPVGLSSDLFWSENTNCDLVSGGPGRLRRRANPAGAGDVTIQKTDLVGPASLEVTDSNVFWVDSPSGSRSLERASLASSPLSCDAHCGAQAPGGCWCDTACTGFGDCCSDFVEQCPAADSCDGRCGTQAPAGCWCDTACTGLGDCCPDFPSTCP
jgi:hypothetical protein